MSFLGTLGPACLQNLGNLSSSCTTRDDRVHALVRYRKIKPVLRPTWGKIPVFLVNEQDMDAVYPPGKRYLLDEELTRGILKKYAFAGFGDQRDQIESISGEEDRRDQIGRISGELQECLRESTTFVAMGVYTRDPFDKYFRCEDAGPKIFICPERVDDWAASVAGCFPDIPQAEIFKILFSMVLLHELVHAYLDTDLSVYSTWWGRVIEESMANGIAYESFDDDEKEVLAEAISSQPVEYRSYGYWLQFESLVFQTLVSAWGPRKPAFDPDKSFPEVLPNDFSTFSNHSSLPFKVFRHCSDLIQTFRNSNVRFWELTALGILGRCLTNILRVVGGSQIGSFNRRGNMSNHIVFDPKELKGSRLRCLMLTSPPRYQVADVLNMLVRPYAVVGPNDKWMPEGFLAPDEAKLGETPGFLSDVDREGVTSWWLAVREPANTPNWDIASTCDIGGKKGLILVEAKAHEGELNVRTDHCASKNENNQTQIASAINQANTGLSTVSGPGWSLSPQSCYQLSNRFAWAWKVASLGIPVVLVYLGFRNTQEMNYGQRTILTTPQQWESCVRTRTNGIVPPMVWNSKLMINGTPLIALIRTADVNISAMIP